MQKIAIIGFGCAGYHAAKAIREHNQDCQIDVYSDTAEAPYNPMLTTYFVSQRITEQEMFPFGTLEEICANLNLNVFCRTPVIKLHAKAKTIELASGELRNYDDIVIASGARAVLPPIKNLPARGIFTMRTTDDARKLNQALESGPKTAVVIGAQMVGIKAVELLAARGVHVTLADMASRLFPLSAFPSTSKILERRLAEQGIALKFGSAVTAVQEDAGRLNVSYGDGTAEACDIVVFCSGIRSNLSFLDPGEIDIGVAIKTDLHMRTTVPHIYAAGDCCETISVSTGESSYIGLWANSAMEGTVAGENICGLNTAYQGNLIHNITHYMNNDFISLGDISAEGTRVFWEKQDKSWHFEATVKGGKILAINILDNAHISGPAKQVLLRKFAQPSSAMSETSKLILLQSGLSPQILAEIGG